MPCKHASVLTQKNEYYCWLHCQHVVLPSVEFWCHIFKGVMFVSTTVSASITRCRLFYNVRPCLLASSEWSLLLVLMKIQVRVGMGVHSSIALLCSKYRTSFNSEAHMCCIDASGINASPLQSKLQCERLYRDDTYSYFTYMKSRVSVHLSGM